MSEKQIQDMRRIQQAFQQNRLEFVNGKAIIHEPIPPAPPAHSEHEHIYETKKPPLTLQAFIQNEHNASKFYHNLAQKTEANQHKQKETLNKLSHHAKTREQNLSKIYAKRHKKPYKPRVPNIHTDIDTKQGIQWALEVENENINTMLSYRYKARIINIIQSKMTDQSLLLLALFYYLDNPLT